MNNSDLDESFNKNHELETQVGEDCYETQVREDRYETQVRKD